MSPTLRNILAVVVGLAVGGAVNMGLITLNMSVLYPAPAKLDPSDTVAFQAYLDGLPTAAFLVVVLAHLGQAAIGGWVAARLAAGHPMRLAMIIGLASLFGGISMMQTVKGPTWMYAELPGYLLVAWLAGRIEEGRRAKKRDS